MYNSAILYAQGAAQAPVSPSWGSLVPIALMILIFYFLLIRPQQKKEKERKAMISAIREGDRVLTAGGIYGTVSSVKDDIVVLKISNNTKAEFTKSSIQAKVNK